MESVLLDTPAGITARLGWDPKLTVHDRRRILARELVAAELGVDLKDVRVDREAPQVFGYHTRLIATRSSISGTGAFAAREETELPYAIKTASFRTATVVAVSDPSIAVGLDIRDTQPDEASIREMRRHSHLFDGGTVPSLLAHWTRVQAILEADARGARVHPEHVRLDFPPTTGWIPDRKLRYKLADLSRDAWIITLAYATAAVG